jgi:pimeloyl-ACP methyl ester carboxylesterase
MRRKTLWFALGALVALAALIVRPDIPRDVLVAAYAQPPSRFAEIEGMRVHYRDEGQGPPLLLIHGTASSLHTWEGWVTELASHRRVLRLDLPGFGVTGAAPDHDYSIARYVRFVGAFLDHVGVARVDVAGNSLGGRIAATFALDHPERVRRLVLVDASGLHGQRPPAIFRLARTPVLKHLLKIATPRFLVKKNVREVYGDPARATDAIVDRYAELARGEGNRVALVERLNGPPDPDLDRRLAEMRPPVLLLWGANDRWIPPSFGERFAAGLPNARLVTFPGLGHVPMEEDPEATVREADRFLSE